MMLSRTFLLFQALVLAFVSFPALAQSTDFPASAEAKRPRIALVLSGGGAR